MHEQIARRIKCRKLVQLVRANFHCWRLASACFSDSACALQNATLQFADARARTLPAPALLCYCFYLFTSVDLLNISSPNRLRRQSNCLSKFNTSGPPTKVISLLALPRYYDQVLANHRHGILSWPLRGSKSPRQGAGCCGPTRVGCQNTNPLRRVHKTKGQVVNQCRWT